jgi:cell wall assembly regulator SMI1
MDGDRRKLLIGASLVGLAALIAGPAYCGMKPQRKGPFGTTLAAPPERPSGRPRPLIEEDVAPVLARLDRWYAANLPADQYVFNAPATDAAIKGLERAIGTDMPPAWRQLYRWHDGEKDDRHGHIYGLPLLPLADVASQLQSWAKILAYFKGDRYPVPGGGWPEGAVDPAYINPRWIPLTHDGSGNHIGIDLDPWPAGRVGQVILYGRDEDVKVVLAESLGKFIGWIADLLEGGNYRLTTENGEQRLRDFALRDPPVDHFHDGARKLSGAPGPYL